ncbi:MAG TPA: permease [Chloroflexia bacterium]|nr:permease [Chloroflexia bacterium]
MLSESEQPTTAPASGVRPHPTPPGGRRVRAAGAPARPPTDRARSRGFYPVLAVLSLVLLFLQLTRLSGADLSTAVSNFSVIFLSIFIEAAPFLLLGTVVSGLIAAFVRPEQLTRWVPRNPVLASLVGAGAGFVFPVCECGVVPVVRQLYAKGLSPAVGVTFLLAAPVMNPIVLLSTITAFGFGPMLVGRYVVTLVVAMTAGLVFAWRARRPGRVPADAQALLRAPAGPRPGAEGPRPPIAARLGHALVVASDEFFEMGRYLVIGAALAAALQTLVSPDVLTALGQGPLVSVLTMQGLAFVLSVCSTVDAFLALTFVGTFSGGSILTFLTFGPMVDIKSLLMFLGVFQRKTVALLVGLPLGLTLLVGVALNLLRAF